jgi:hypothetical protein
LLAFVSHFCYSFWFDACFGCSFVHMDHLILLFDLVVHFIFWFVSTFHFYYLFVLLVLFTWIRFNLLLNQLLLNHHVRWY